MKKGGTNKKVKKKAGIKLVRIDSKKRDKKELRTNLKKTIKRLPRGLLKKIKLRFANDVKKFDGENKGSRVYHKSTTKRKIETPIQSKSRIEEQNKSSIASSIAASIMEENLSSSPEEDDKIKDIKSIILSNLKHIKILKLITEKKNLDNNDMKLLINFIRINMKKNNETIPDLKIIIKTIKDFKKKINEPLQ
jgi:hypothetical protein